jgi:hypothetical protein
MNIATIMNRTVAQAKRTGENKTAKIPIIVVVTLEDGILIPEITPVLAYITNPGVFDSGSGSALVTKSEVVDTVSKPLIGSPDPRRICTSIIERSNLSMRTSIRRLTRLTNAFSKKWDNLHAMLSLYFAYYNFCRIHSSIRCTPAMESGITGHVWSLREMLQA